MPDSIERLGPDAERSPATPFTARALIVLAVLFEVGIVATGGMSSAPRLTHMPWTPMLLAHGAAVLACMGAWQTMNNAAPRAADAWAWRLGALGIALLGPLGVVGAALGMLLQRTFTAQGAAMDPVWLRVVAADDADAMHVQREQHKIDGLMVNRPSVSPFSDVMSYGTSTQKQDVVAAIGAHFKPPFARTLQRALRDREPSVRIMAAVTTARIENTFLDSLTGLENDWASHPGEATRALELAQQYDAYANTGLLDDGRALDARERALEMYLLAREQQRDDTLIDHAVIRLLVKLHREDEAIETFRAAMDRGTATPTLTSWYLEALFRRRQFAALRHYSSPLLTHDRHAITLDDRSLQAAHLWAHGAAENQNSLVLMDGNDVIDGEPAPRTSRARRHAIDVPYFAPRSL